MSPSQCYLLEGSAICTSTDSADRQVSALPQLMQLMDFFMSVQKLIYLHCQRERRGEGREEKEGHYICDWPQAYSFIYVYIFEHKK